MATDAEIRAAGLYAVPNRQYLQNEFQLPTKEVVEEETESFGIPQTQAFTNSGGGGENNFFNSPYTAQTGYKTNRVSDYSGYLPGTRPEPSKFQPAMDLIGKGIGMAIPGGNFLMGLAKNQSRENRLSATDNAFIDMQLANQEQSMHGGGNLTNQDRYGYNKVSAFGNYADLVSKNAAAGLAKPKNERTDFDNYFIQKGEEEEDINNQIAANNALRQKSIANKIREQIKAGTATDPGAALHSELGSGRVTSSVIQGEGGGNTPGTSRASDHGGVGLGHNAGNVRSANAAGTGSKQGYNQNLRSGGRAGYFFGGRVNYKVGGRTDAGANRTTASKVGVGQINESGQKVSGGNYNNNNDGGVTKPVFYDKNDNIITTDFISKDPNLTINYADPRNYASLKSKIGFNNILDNDDLTAEGNVTGQIGKFGYNTNFTDQGITGTNLTAGNVSANISPDMQLENLSYSKGPFRISSDGQNTRAGLTFSYKNGGLASIL